MCPTITNRFDLRAHVLSWPLPWVPEVFSLTSIENHRDQSNAGHQETSGSGWFECVNPIMLPFIYQNLTPGFDWTIEKPFLKRAAMVCCVSKISSYSWCQWMWGLYLLLPEGYLSHCSWLTFAASLLNSIVPKEKKPLYQGTLPFVLDHINYSLYFNFNNHFLEKAHTQNLSCSVNTVTYHNPTWVIV